MLEDVDEDRYSAHIEISDHARENSLDAANAMTSSAMKISESFQDDEATRNIAVITPV